MLVVYYPDRSLRGSIRHAVKDFGSEARLHILFFPRDPGCRWVAGISGLAWGNQKDFKTLDLGESYKTFGNS